MKSISETLEMARSNIYERTGKKQPGANRIKRLLTWCCSLTSRRLLIGDRPMGTVAFMPS